MFLVSLASKILVCMSLYFIIKSIYINIWIKNIEKFKNKRFSLEDKEDIYNLSYLWATLFPFFSIPFTASVFMDSKVKISFIEYFDLYFFVILIILIILLINKYNFYFGKSYKKVKNDYLLKQKLSEIKELINNLLDRQKILQNYDANDIYRSEDIIKIELQDLNTSIELLRKLYSYIELNDSNLKVNKGFNILKKTNINNSDLKEFQKEIDIINSKKCLDLNVDECIESLKRKYKES